MTSIRIEKSGERMDKLKNAEDPSVVYADIINLPHHQSDTHPHMSLYDRAAQFAPFAALSGYDAMVAEEARVVDEKIELGEKDKELLNQKLCLIADAVEDGDRPTVDITYFMPDPLKPGGKYRTVTETVKKIDTVRRCLILEKTVGVAGIHGEIQLDDILELKGDLLDTLESE